MFRIAIAIAAASTCMAAPPVYKLQNRIKIGGAARWDYLFVDSTNHRLYVSHGTQTEVVDTISGKLVDTISDTKGVHGIAVADDLGKGFTSNGTTNDVTVFDLKTSRMTGIVKVGQNPDAIIYEPVTHRVFVFNGRSNDATVFDAKTNEPVSASVALGGKPEFAQVNGKGNVYVNIEDKNEIVELSARDATVTKRYSVAPCDGPSGLAINSQNKRLYSVCDKVMVISDPVAGKVVGTAVIGQGVDGVAFDDGYAFSANGRDGTVTMVGEISAGKFGAVQTIKTQQGARTIGSDQKAHKLYLPAAEYGAATTGADGKAVRPQPLPDSFEILVLGR